MYVWFLFGKELNLRAKRDKKRIPSLRNEAREICWYSYKSDSNKMALVISRVDHKHSCHMLHALADNEVTTYVSEAPIPFTPKLKRFKIVFFIEVA